MDLTRALNLRRRQISHKNRRSLLHCCFPALPTPDGLLLSDGDYQDDDFSLILPPAFSRIAATLKVPPWSFCFRSALLT